MTQAEYIEQHRKATEDLIQSNVKTIFQVKSGETVLQAGDNIITLPGDNYSSDNIYEVVFISALDEDQVDISGALVVTDQDTTSFTVNSPRIGTLRWQSCLKTPNFSFWT